jgi:hypothetical protein
MPRVNDFVPGGVIGVASDDAEATASVWRACGWSVAEAVDLPACPGGVLLRIALAPSTSEVAQQITV